MSEIKVFRITGKIVKPNLKTTFRKEIRALNPENAKEKIYTDVGSKHRAKRFQIRILAVEEIPPEEIQDPLIRKLTLGEEPNVE
ncbi:MAG: 50S ribosomal protein L18Ae [Candidatus Bathyarchaeota archaeon]|jgi:large subunit ribosomal protein LX|nr:50S ribosomal protein L18Ae [Candidatus Bathyarchaeota archaeon]